jgi:hypothetical protein
MAGEEPIVPATQRVRRIDASLRTLAIESLRAIIGILIAFSVSWWISGALHLRSGFGGYAGTAAIFVVAALVALTITSGLPIHDALAAQRAEISRQQELLQAAADRHQFNSDLHTALERASPGRRQSGPSPSGRRIRDQRGPGLRRRHALGMSGNTPRPDPRILGQQRAGDLPSPSGAPGTGVRALCARDRPRHVDGRDPSDRTG